MKQTRADILIEKVQFNSYDDFKTYPTSDLKCPTCNKTVSLAFKDLEKHQHSDFSNLTDDEQKSINEFVELNLKEVPNSFLDFMDLLSKWTKKINEIKPCVWTVTMIHELGPKVEMTGENLEEIEKDVEKSALEMDKQIEETIKNTAHNNG